MQEELVLKDKLVKEVNSIRSIALIAVFTGLVFLSTSLFYVYIPTSNGFFNIGEIFVYLAALIGGPITGAISGGLGASMADLALGFGIFAPGTVIIKAVEGFVVGLLFHYSKRIKKWVKYIFVGVLCSFLIGFSIFLFNKEIELGMALYGGRTFTALIPGYTFLIISLVLSVIIILVLFFLKEKGEMALSCSIGGTLMVLGYFLYEIIFLSYPVGVAASELPFNFAQAIFGAAISIPIVSYLSDLGILRSKVSKGYDEEETTDEDIEEEVNT